MSVNKPSWARRLEFVALGAVTRANGQLRVRPSSSCTKSSAQTDSFLSGAPFACAASYAAKCAAVRGFFVQSNNRVGSPWCCASAIKESKWLGGQMSGRQEEYVSNN